MKTNVAGTSDLSETIWVILHVRIAPLFTPSFNISKGVNIFLGWFFKPVGIVYIKFINLFYLILPYY